MTLQADHLQRVRAVLATFPEDLRPALALLALQDAEMAIEGGIRLGLTMEQILRCSSEVIEELKRPRPQG